MKTLLSGLCLILSFLCFKSSGQTVRYYVAEAAYDKDGIKHAPTGWPQAYLAFVNNNNIIYMCHKDGSTQGIMYQWRYVTTKNGIRVYQAVPNNVGLYPFPWLYITPDFSRVNMIRRERDGNGVPNFEDPGWTYVFQQSDSGNLSAPSTFY